MNDLIPILAASPLRQRLIDDMTMRRFSLETQRNYIRDVGRLATWLGRSPHTAMADGHGENPTLQALRRGSFGPTRHPAKNHGSLRPQPVSD